MSISLPLLIYILFASTVNVLALTQQPKDLVPCTMCAECDNPCQPLPPSPPPPSPPPPVVECPPPPSPSPPPPSPPLPPAIVECPPPPKMACGDNCEIPEGPPAGYFPSGTPYEYYVPGNVKNSGGKMKPYQGILFSNYLTSYSLYFTNSFIYVYLFDV
ncbi:sulfated surface glycoprotein 185-like [Vigna radiata var. radiata]|uniref:Sulfated surface glycoprotein 185-like n=1 Tax=Vigna radiata var. radiata TaxID=3916 RepID=A0A3Q0EUB3_VIGRR|nr:sulfated surface glycoprotein 185-like [Vigna radiata var. radiata]